MINYNPEELSKCVSLEINLNELHMLSDLLKVESVYQLRTILAMDSLDETEKLLRLISTFEDYRNLDDGLFDLKLAIKENAKSGTDVIIVNKATAICYKLFCTETPKLNLDPKLVTRVQEYVPNLIKKLDYALDNASDFPEAVKSATDSFKQTAKTKTEDLGVNIFQFKNKAKA